METLHDQNGATIPIIIFDGEDPLAMVKGMCFAFLTSMMICAAIVTVFVWAYA